MSPPSIPLPGDADPELSLRCSPVSGPWTAPLCAKPKSGAEQLGQQTRPLAAHPPAAEGLDNPPGSHSRPARCCGHDCYVPLLVSSAQALLAMEQTRSAQCSSSLCNPATEPPPPGPGLHVLVPRSGPKGGSKGQG